MLGGRAHVLERPELGELDVVHFDRREDDLDDGQGPQAGLATRAMPLVADERGVEHVLWGAMRDASLKHVVPSVSTLIAPTGGGFGTLGGLSVQCVRSARTWR